MSWPRDQLDTLTGQIAHAIRWRRKRLWRRTLGKRSYERQPTIANAQRLMDQPAPGDLELAGSVLDALLQRTEPPGLIIRQLVVDQAIASLGEDGDDPAAVSRVERIARVQPVRALMDTRRFIDFLRDTGRRDAALVLAERLLAETGEAGYGTILHKLQIASGDFNAARETELRVAATLPEGDREPLMMRVNELLSMDNHEQALATLRQLKPTFSPQYTRTLIQALVGIGDHRSVLDYLDAYDSGLTQTAERRRRFDAHFALGDRSLAEAELAGVADTDTDEHVLSRLTKAFGPDAAAKQLERLADSVPSGDVGPDDLEDVGVILFRSNSPQEAVAVLRRADEVRRLTPVGLQALAQSLYSLRMFEEALIEIDRLAGTPRHWAAMKLKGRVLIQLNRPAEALANRQRYGRPGDATDQVQYHALLSLGRHAEAFRLHPFANDLTSLQAVFGDSAETHPNGAVASRFVVADAGPGDDIQDASLYGELQGLSERLTSTCDPRLHTLLQRSFPEIEFVSVERLRHPPYFASHGPSAEPRSRNALDRLLTQRAYELASSHDHVVLGRAVKNVRDFARGPAPQSAFLLPDPNRVERWAKKLASSRPVIGIVWRSEFQTSWRANNYLTADELSPLASLDARFTCLQHDVTDDERDSLKATFGGRMRFLDDTDLRDDFEEAAALVASLDLTIGVGTTMTNLAAAVGCPTIMMQPTHFGSWLSTNDHGADFWYEACTVVVAEPPYDITQLVSRTFEAATQRLRAVHPGMGPQPTRS